MSSYRFQNELVGNRVKEGSDIKIDYPVPPPATLSADAHSLQRRSPWSIAVRVRMEYGLHLWLEIQTRDRLGDAVSYRGHSKDSDLALPELLRYFDCQHRRREVTPRRQPIPELVQVPSQVLFKLLDRLAVNTGRSIVGLDPLVRFPDLPFGNRKRLVLRLRSAQQLLPPLGS